MKSLNELKICITGSFGYKDIGDEAMLTEDLDYVVNTLGVPRQNIDLIGGDPGYMSEYHRHPVDHCFSCWWFERHLHQKRRGLVGRARSRLRRAFSGQPKVAKRVRDCDLVLVTGGGTVNTRDFQGNSLKRMHALVTHFKRLGKPIFMSGQTIGPLGRYDHHDRMAAEIVNAVDVLTVRDSRYSRRYLDIINASPKRFVETYDDACSLPYKDEQLPNDVVEFLELGPAAAVNVTEYTADTAEKRMFIADLCESIMSEHNLNIILVSHDVSDFSDLNVIRDMISNDLKKCTLLPDTRLWRDKVLKKMISGCSVAVGGRYHFIVLAGTSNTPFVGMCGNHYSYIKQDGFARPVGLEDFILTEKETWDLGVVKSKIASALERKIVIDGFFPRPTESMELFGEWVRACAGIQEAVPELLQHAGVGLPA